MGYYETLSKPLIERMQEEKRAGTFVDLAFNDNKALRRVQNPHDQASVLRSCFIRDIDKILNCPFYNRYGDKTQVFSLCKNDDITHRSLHVQLVSRIARTIGKALNLNLELIEAIALGHDLGHTPFGHTGEAILDQIYREYTGRSFAHNVHSVRVLDKIFPFNVTLQTLDGILCHNGELELDKYTPNALDSFEEFDNRIEKCYTDPSYVKQLIPCTLEGCIVRIADIIAYLGKDRHDAEKHNLLSANDFTDYGIGKINAEIVNNLMVNIIEYSYGKPYIKMDKAHFEALKKAKSDNYAYIYGNPGLKERNGALRDMFYATYQKLLADLQRGNTSSPVFTHHIDYLNVDYYKKKRTFEYIDTENNQIIVDYFASMTDDYFVDLYAHLFPKQQIKLAYKGYFD